MTDRRAWLNGRRAAVKEDYSRDAATYDQDDIPITPTHRRFVGLLVDRCPPGGVVLDAACGTGKYFGLVEAAGLSVVGIDQSAGMLAQARAKHPAAKLETVGLQELTYVAEFDGVMCIDAMEHVFPEDWPRVLANLHHAARPGAHVYLTIEEIDGRELEKGFAQADALGLPVVRGEHVGESTGGYHYYPDREQVAGWLDAEGLRVVEEGYNQGKSYGYRHLLLRDSVYGGFSMTPIWREAS